MKILTLLTLLYFMLLVSILPAQAPDTAWTIILGGNDDDVGRWVEETSDGNYIIAGFTKTYGAGENDAWLLKVDASGDSVWAQTYGGFSNDYGFTVQQTYDGGYIIGGQTFSYGAGGMDAWLIKTDTLGQVDWSNTYGTNMYELGYSARQTLDGGYIICSQTLAFGAGALDIWLIKTDALGDTQWTKTYGGIDDDWGRFALQTSDSGYIILGQTESFGAGNYDIYVIKTTSTGDTIWTNTYGNANSDYSYSLDETDDGGYVIAATSTLHGIGGNDAVLIRVNADGNTIWTKAYGGIEQDEGMHVHQTSDGGFILTGYTASFGNGVYDIFIVKTDALGDTMWTKTVGGPGTDIGRCIKETSDGGYIVVGQTDSLGITDDDLWLIKLEPDPTKISEDNSINIPAHHQLYQNYPNPFNPHTVFSWQLVTSSNVKLIIYTVSGQKVATLLSASLPSGSYKYEWNASHLASGVYLYRLQADNHVLTRKMVLIK